jgi:L-ascorbate metabolism protein UlaG (beta-lactamase superfamily)
VTSGSTSVGFVGHATVVIDVGGVRVLTDPFLRTRLGPLERHGARPDPETTGNVDIVVISHGHQDHFDRSSLAAIGGRPTIVVPRGLGPAARSAVEGPVVELTAGEAATIAGVRIEAVPARHWISPGSPRARPVGYLLDMGVRVYFAGDTGRLSAMRDLAGTVDVALLPVWTWGPHLGPGHLGPRSAAEALVDIQPAVAIPIHWGTLYPARLHHVWRRALTEPGDRFALHAARAAPGVDVRVLRPGEATRLDLR